MTFRLAAKVEGPNPLYWLSIDQLIGIADIPIDPDAAYTPQSDTSQALSGMTFPRGFATATWHFSSLTAGQRQILRSFCPAPALSAEIYIETLSNELSLCNAEEWFQGLAIMHWTAGDEEQQATRTMSLDILFTHLIEI